MIDPKSIAGVLLREHDSAHQAYKYALRKAQLLAGMNNGAACDYYLAASQIFNSMAPDIRAGLSIPQ